MVAAEAEASGCLEAVPSEAETTTEAVTDFYNTLVASVSSEQLLESRLHHNYFLLFYIQSTEKGETRINQKVFLYLHQEFRKKIT